MFDAQKISQEVIGQVSGYFSQLLQQLFMGGAEVAPHLASGLPWQAAIISISPLAESIRELCDYANGDSDGDPMYINEAIQGVCETLFVAPGGAYSYDIPEQFWATDLGRCIMHCRMKMGGDELITISQAAELAYGENTQANRMKIQRAIRRGDLTPYAEPTEANPQHNTRLSRAEVGALNHG